MTAATFQAREHIRIENVQKPSHGPGQVQVRDAYSGVCGSDLHVYYSPEASGLDFTRPHPVTGSLAPQIPGHEFSGTIVELGTGVEGQDLADAVATATNKQGVDVEFDAAGAGVALNQGLEHTARCWSWPSTRSHSSSTRPSS